MTWLQCGDGPILVPDPDVQRAWQRDRTPWFATVLLIDSAELEARRLAVARALAPWLSPSPQSHVTLHVSGPGPPWTETELVEVTAGGADSFAAAAFLHATGPLLADLRRSATLRVGQEVDPSPIWVPHITVGTYRSPVPAQVVADRLEHLRTLPPLCVQARLTGVEVPRHDSPATLREIRE